MNISNRMVLSVLVGLLLVLPVLTACGGSDDEETVKSTSQADDLAEMETITIGNLTDKTGPISNALSIMDLALEDMVNHFNDNNLIPGVELKVIEYDAQYNPSKHIPGYEWLKERGADIIYSSDPNAIETLKPRVDEDQIVAFASSAQEILLENPGYAFTAGTYPVNLYYTLLDWIAENHWDYATKGPATVGMGGWTTAINIANAEGMEQYCIENPEQFEWAGSYFVDGGFNWAHEANELKDCDYVFPPTGGYVPFVNEYRSAGGTGTLIGSDTHCSFFSLIGDARLWDEIDGMLFIRESEFWTDEGEFMDLVKKLLYENRPDEAEEIIRSGVGYMVISHDLIMLEIIQKAAEAVGPQNLDSQAIYEAAQDYSLTLDGIQRFSFTDTKRFGCDRVTVYEANGAEETIVRVEPEWIPLIRLQ